MSELKLEVIDLDFPVGSRNKTATLITGERARCWWTPDSPAQMAIDSSLRSSILGRH